MTIWRIIFANLKHSRRQHLGTCLGLAFASMVLIGSLSIGDSVRATLSYRATERLGLITHLFMSRDGYFQSDLADRILDSLDQGVKVAPALMTTGIISSPDGKVRASGITVLGIDQRFFSFAQDTESVPDLTNYGFWASPDLGLELGTEVGSRLVLRVEEPSLFSRDAPLSGERDARFISWNRPYFGEVKPAALGNFSLRASMEPSRTVFVPLSMLQQDMFETFTPNQDQTNFANLLLVSGIEQQIKDVGDALEANWSFEDAGLQLKKLSGDEEWCLRSRSVFLPDSIVETARQIHPSVQGELTYLVNAIRGQGGEALESLIPYSMVTGVQPHPGGVLQPGWEEDKVALNQWAANDLNLSVGDFVTLEYFVLGERRELIENNRSFQIGKILPMPGKIPTGEESDWTPRFPGLSDAENCGEWDTGIPIKHKIRKKDEDYWDEYRGTPKAFISLKAAQDMWGNRWGNLTGMRITGEQNSRKFKDQLIQKMSPESFGMLKIDLKKNAEQAIEGPVDFRQLFLSFGFFVMLAGLTLSAIIFGFSLEQRNRQVGMLLSLGYSPTRVNFITWMEAGLVCLIGTSMGLGWSWFFGHATIWMLNGAWGDAVSNLSIFYAPQWNSVILGTGTSLAVGFLSLFWISRKQTKSRPVELLQAGEFLNRTSGSGFYPGRYLGSRWTELLVWVGLIFLVINSLLLELPAGPSFFGIGALALTGGMMRIVRAEKVHADKNLRGRKNLLFHLDSRTGRKMTVVGMLAVGTFLVVGAGAFRQQGPEESKNFKSGTGGFSHIFKTSLPLYDDLHSEGAGELFDLNTGLLDGVSIIPVRAQSGDDASCLNLHQSSQPPLYGLPIAQMSGRFAFVEGNWSTLTKRSKEGLIPAAVDQNTLMWSLKKKVGDRVAYLDEGGEKFEVELAAVLKGSYLQGGLYISEENWIKKFPRGGGYKEFWIGSAEHIDPAVDRLTDRLLNYGAQNQQTLDRLNQFRRVENTYLSIFQALGGMGVLLGTMGLLIIVLRNLWERRKEHAILGAVGFSLGKLQFIVIQENIRIIFAGLLIGFGAGLVGLVPAVMGNKQDISLISLWAFGICLFIFSLFSLITGVRIGLNKIPLHSLRDE